MNIPPASSTCIYWAEAFFNGKSAGILWKKPFSVDSIDLVEKKRK